MIKRINLVTVIFLAVIFLSAPSYASIFLDFNTPSPDPAPGNYDHTITTAYGNINFNGRVWNGLNDDCPFPDHTTGDGYFLKNTVANAGHTVSITFDFGVDSIDLSWLGVDNFNMIGVAFDEDGNKLGDLGVNYGDGEWHDKSIGGFARPIRKFNFFAKRGKNRVGNKIIIDDVTIHATNEPLTPEPASLVLFGTGLLAFLTSTFLYNVHTNVQPIRQ